MITGPILAEIAALVGDPARATIVLALIDGRALTATELAVAARITPQTASTHLAKLTAAGVLSVTRNGRPAQRGRANTPIANARRMRGPRSSCAAEAGRPGGSR